MVTLVGVDTGAKSLQEADHLVHDLVARFGLPAHTLACTHLIRSDQAHVAVSFRVPSGFDLWEPLTGFAEDSAAGVASGTERLGPEELASAAADAAVEHVSRKAGRAVVYPGSSTLAGTVTVGELLANSAIDRIAVVGGQGDPVDTDVVETRDHVRPEWRDGVLTLAVTPVRPGVYAPFEVPNPTPCCADHG